MNVKPIKQKDMYIVLEINDCKKIAQAIVNSDKESGTVYAEIEGLEFEVEFSKEVNGYTEDETGAFVCTDAFVRVENVKCGDIRVEFYSRHIESLAEEMLEG